MHLDFYEALLKINLFLFLFSKGKAIEAFYTVHQKECTNKSRYGKSKHGPIQESIEIQTSEMQIHFLKLPKIRISGMNASNLISNIFFHFFYALLIRNDTADAGRK